MKDDHWLAGRGKPFLQVLLLGLLACWGVWLYSAALGLPPSLVDDYAQLDNLHNWVEAYRQGQLIESLKTHTSIVNRTYNLGFHIITALQYGLTGGKPFHWLKLVELAFVSVMLFGVVLRGVAGRWIGFAAAYLAVFLFLSVDVPGGIDLHGLRTSWFRLFASDSMGLVFLSAHVFCLSRLMPVNSGWRQWLWVVSAVVTGFVATTVKIPFIGLVTGPLVCAVAAALIARQWRTATRISMVFGAILGMFALFFFAVKRLADSSEVSAEAYGTNYSLSLDSMLAGAKFTWETLFSAYGPLLPAIAAMCVVGLVTSWKARAENPRHFLLLMYLLAFTVCAAAIYFPWNGRLPRYLLCTHFGVAALAGMAFNESVQAIASPSARRVPQSILAGAGAAATLLPPLVLYAFLAAALLLCLWRRWTGATLISAAGLVGLLYILAIVPLLRSSLNNFYVAGEQANWHAVQDVIRYSQEGRTVYFGGNTRDEQIGSMAGHIKLMGVNPLLKPLPDGTDSLTTGMLVLLHRHLSPEEYHVRFARQMPVSEYGFPRPDFKVPVPFQGFRRRLLRQEDHYHKAYDSWVMDPLWQFYEAI